MCALSQIGAYDQQVWEKSLVQTDLNVRHLQTSVKKYIYLLNFVVLYR